MKAPKFTARTAEWYLVRGPGGAGLHVGRHKRTGCITCIPVEENPQVGTGFVLSPEAAGDLALLLAHLMREPRFALAASDRKEAS